MTGAGVSRSLREAESLHAGVELAAAQAKQFGRFGPVLAGLLERALDERALDRLEVHPVSWKRPDRGVGGWDDLGGRWGRGRAFRRPSVPGQMLGIDQAPLTQNQRPLLRVAQLADVPRPPIGQEVLARLPRYPRCRPP